MVVGGAHCFVGRARLDGPAHSVSDIESARQKGLENSNTLLSSFDTFLREPITKLASPPLARYWLV